MTQVFARFFDNSVERREGRAVSLVKHPSYSTKLAVNALLNMKAILDRLKGFRKISLENNFRTNNDRILSIFKCKRIMFLLGKKSFILGANCRCIYNFKKAVR